MREAAGFTLVEVLLVLGLFSVLISIATLNLIRPQKKTTSDTSVTTLVSDIKQQQLKAMIGDSFGQTTAQSHGIFFETDGYTLFKGSTYNPNDAANIKFALTQGTTFSTINFSGNELVFERISGDFSGYASGLDSVVLSGGTGLDTTVTVNTFGGVTVN